MTTPLKVKGNREGEEILEETEFLSRCVFFFFSAECLSGGRSSGQRDAERKYQRHVGCLLRWFLCKQSTPSRRRPTRPPSRFPCKSLDSRRSYLKHFEPAVHSLCCPLVTKKSLFEFLFHHFRLAVSHY